MSGSAKQRSKNHFRFHHPYALIASLLVLLISGLAVWAYSGAQAKITASVEVSTKTTSPVTLAPDTQVAVFTARTGQWIKTPFADVKPGSEFTYSGHFYRLTDSGKAEMLPGIDVSKLADADSPYDKTNHRAPQADDVVQVLSKEIRVVGHAVLRTVEPGTRICFQGRAYDLATDRSLLDTGIVSARVTKTFQHTGSNAANTLIDVTIRTLDGKQSVLHATPNHPFYVPNRKQYVELGELKPGTRLKTADYGEATIVAMNTRNGKFDVYNLEVEGPHNYHVGDQKVLVHNKPQISNLNKRAGDLISGGLKRVKGYPSNLEDLTYQQILEEVDNGTPGAQLMKKLIEQSKRLKGKGY
ncbi:MAG: Hint domain-containing protein [Armatimonadota bacterium]